jgi:hypothetical protein
MLSAKQHRCCRERKILALLCVVGLATVPQGTINCLRASCRWRLNAPAAAAFRCALCSRLASVQVIETHVDGLQGQGFYGQSPAVSCGVPALGLRCLYVTEAAVDSRAFVHGDYVGSLFDLKAACSCFSLKSAVRLALSCRALCVCFFTRCARSWAVLESVVSCAAVVPPVFEALDRLLRTRAAYQGVVGPG